MTPNEVRAVVLDIKPSTWRRYVIIAFAGLFLGISGFQLFLIVQNKPPYFDNAPPKLHLYGDYVGIEIDHTRNNFCEIKPQRFLFTTKAIADPQNIPIVYPIPTGAYFIWPMTGRIHLIVLIPLPRDLPAGQWFIQSVAYDDCHWYSGWLHNQLLVSKPIEVTLKGPTTP